MKSVSLAVLLLCAWTSASAERARAGRHGWFERGRYEIEGSDACE